MTIKEFREKDGLTTYDLAKLLGVNQSTVVRLENGKSVPTIATAQRLAIVMNRDISEIINDFSKQKSY